MPYWTVHTQAWYQHQHVVLYKHHQGDHAVYWLLKCGKHRFRLQNADYDGELWGDRSGVARIRTLDFGNSGDHILDVSINTYTINRGAWFAHNLFVVQSNRLKSIGVIDSSTGVVNVPQGTAIASDPYYHLAHEPLSYFSVKNGRISTLTSPPSLYAPVATELWNLLHSWPEDTQLWNFYGVRAKWAGWNISPRHAALKLWSELDLHLVRLSHGRLQGSTEETQKDLAQFRGELRKMLRAMLSTNRWPHIDKDDVSDSFESKPPVKEIL